MFAYVNFTTHICGQEAPQKLYQRMHSKQYLPIRFAQLSKIKPFGKGQKEKF